MCSVLLEYSITHGGGAGVDAKNDTFAVQKKNSLFSLMNANVRKKANLFLRLAIMVLTVVFLYRQLFAKTGSEQWTNMIELCCCPAVPEIYFMLHVRCSH